MRAPLMASVMILAIVIAGAMRLSLWFVPFAAILMMIAYVWQKRSVWQARRADVGPFRTALGLPLVYLVQLLVTAVFFFIPFGVVSAFAVESPSGSFGASELALLGLAAVGCAGAILTDRTQEPDPTVSGYEDLIDRCVELGRHPVAMPVDIFSLARDFADRPDPDLTLAILESAVADDESPFVRRVAHTAIRYLERPTSETADVHAMVMRGLDDSAAWVRYDAVWAGETLGYRDDVFRDRVVEIADGLEAPPEDVRAEGAEENARFRAARLLQRLDRNDQDRNSS